MKQSVAFISEHASPLASLGEVDNGGQNVYVAELSTQLAAMGYEIDIYTRKDRGRPPETSGMETWYPGDPYRGRSIYFIFPKKNYWIIWAPLQPKCSIISGSITCCTNWCMHISSCRP